MKKLLEKAKRLLERSSGLRDLTRKCDEESDILKSKIWKELETKYVLVFDRSKRSEFQWNPHEFHVSISLLIRSMVKRNKVVRFSNTEEDSFYFNLTQKYGLKRPHTWRSYFFLQIRTEIPKVKDGLWETSNRVKIPFQSLFSRKAIDSKKLKKLLYFLGKIFRLYKSYQRIVKEFKSRFENIEGLYSGSNLDKFTETLKEELRFREYYNEYAGYLEKFKDRQDKLLQEMKDYNKPFRILLVIKSSSDDD